MYIKFLISSLICLFICSTAQAQNAYDCSGPGLNQLVDIDLSTLTSKELKPSFLANSAQFEFFAYYRGADLKVITVSYNGESDREDIKAYFQRREDYLLTYHKQQNSAFYFESDSVLLKEEKSYFHICDGRLLAPAVGGVIDNDLFDKTKLMIDAVLKDMNS